MYIENEKIYLDAIETVKQRNSRSWCSRNLGCISKVVAILLVLLTIITITGIVLGMVPLYRGARPQQQQQVPARFSLISGNAVQ